MRPQLCPVPGLYPALVGIQSLAPIAEAAPPPPPQHCFCFQLGNRSWDNFSYCYPAKTPCAIRPLPIKVKFYGRTSQMDQVCLGPWYSTACHEAAVPLLWLQTGPIPTGCLRFGSSMGKPASTGPRLHACRSRYLPPSTWLSEEGGTDVALPKLNLSAFWNKGYESLYVGILWPDKCPVKVKVMGKDSFLQVHKYVLRRSHSGKSLSVYLVGRNWQAIQADLFIEWGSFEHEQEQLISALCFICCICATSWAVEWELDWKTPSQLARDATI